MRHMRETIFLILVCSLFLFSHQTDDFKDCRMLTTYGYGYKHFFRLQGGTFPQNYVFYLEFYVKAISDAHVLLESGPTGTSSIEIVIGGGSNTFSEIRLMQNEEKQILLTQRTTAILSPDNYKKFQITVDNKGVLTVRAEDDEFLSWDFDRLFPIRFYAFGSWTNTKANWKHGCSIRQNVSESEVFTTDLERLKRDLLKFYNPNTVPSESDSILEVKVHFDMHNVDLSEARGELTVRGSSMLMWNDSKLQWKPQDYGGIDVLFLPPFQIWTPALKTLNVLTTVGNDLLLDLTAAGVSVTNNGSMFWRPPFKSVSMCQVNIVNYPDDVHNCSVYIGFWMEPRHLKLTIVNEEEQMENAQTGSAWRILKATALKGKDDEGNDNYSILYVELQRNAKPITQQLNTAAVILSLTPFFIPKNYSIKFYVSCGSEILFLCSLLLVTFNAPIMSAVVPNIIKTYQRVSIVGLFPIILFVFLEDFPATLKLNRFVERAIHSKFTDWLFQFPANNNRTDYGNFSNSNGEKTFERDAINATRLQSLILNFCFVIYVALIFVAFSLE